MKGYQELITTLENLGISYDIVEHSPALTTQEADRFIEGKEGVRTKTMFLTNKKKTAFYLLIMDDHKRLDMEVFKEKVHANRIRMGSPESLMDKMGLSPGVVSPLGLLQNTEKDIKVYMDIDIADEKVMTFHPNTNEKTIFIKTADLFRFLDYLGYEVEFIQLS